MVQALVRYIYLRRMLVPRRGHNKLSLRRVMVRPVTILQIGVVYLYPVILLLQVHNTPIQVVSSAGAAYVWKRSGTTWTEVKKLIAGNHITTDGRFGISIGISGNTIVVGAGYEDVDGVTHAGVLHVYNSQKLQIIT